MLTNWVSTVLLRGGYSIEYSCKTGADVARVADFCTSPVVVCGFQFPDMTAEDLTELLNGQLAMITVVLPHQRDLIESDDLVVVPYPLSSMELLQAIELVENTAARRAVTVSSSPREIGFHSRERPAEEKLLIIKAKNMLMDQFEMTESQAHRFLQKSSMDRGLKLIDAANMVIEQSLGL